MTRVTSCHDWVLWFVTTNWVPVDWTLAFNATRPLYRSSVKVAGASGSPLGMSAAGHRLNEPGKPKPRAAQRVDATKKLPPKRMIGPDCFAATTAPTQRRPSPTIATLTCPDGHAVKARPVPSEISATGVNSTRIG